MILYLLFTLQLLLTANCGHAEVIRSSGSEIRINITMQPAQVDKAAILAWIRQGTTAVTKLVGRFPVPRLKIDVMENTHQDDGVFGREEDGELVKLYLGKNITPKTLQTDWTLTHELLHLAFPDLDDEFLWAEEGLSTYLEPLARAKSGMITEREFWLLYFDRMHEGLPEPGDDGLNKTHTRLRTYWGGALFWFAADMAIRRETKKTLLDAIHAILVKGGDARETWSMKKVLSVGDKAIGKPILRRMYDQMAVHPGAPDLAGFWRELGIEKKGDGVVFKDSALRKAWLK